jgi:hypothetical protein
MLHDALCGAGKEYGGGRIDRLCISGSRGRATSLANADVDVVIFLNNAKPPWPHALDDISERVQAAFPTASLKKRRRVGGADAFVFRVHSLTYGHPLSAAHTA